MLNKQLQQMLEPSRCSRQHPRPEGSTTLLIPNMFQDVRLTEVMLDEQNQDVGLEVLYLSFVHK